MKKISFQFFLGIFQISMVQDQVVKVVIVLCVCYNSFNKVKYIGEHFKTMKLKPITRQCK